MIARLAFLLGALRGLVRRRPPRSARIEEQDVSRRELPQSPRAQLAAALLLALCGLCSAAFAVLVAVHPQTQLLGATLGAALVALAAALTVAAERVVAQETEVEQRHPPAPEDDAEVVATLRSGGEGISRRRMLGAAAGVASAGLTGAVVLPVTALGPKLGPAQDHGPWHRGRRLVDTAGRPIAADAIEVGSSLTALPEGADRRELGSPVIVVRIAPATIRPPAGRERSSPRGILAFSSICTHAGCAVTLFRYPISEATSRGPALVCPCHYSTFDVRRACKPIFGPAVRPLPQLPLAIDADGSLVAAGPLSGTVGPSWWGSST